MGRRPDTAAVQAAKGNPGRRKSAAVKRAERAAELAAMLAPLASKDADGSTVPDMIAHDPVAVAMWRQLAPVLASTHRLQPQHRPMFLTFCTYYAQFVICNDALSGGKFTQRVKTVAGGMMERMNPMLRARDDAHKKCAELSKLFGLTPADEYALFKDQAAAASAGNGWLFGDSTGPGEMGKTDTAPVEVEQPSMIGQLSAMDSLPPGTRVQ